MEPPIGIGFVGGGMVAELHHQGLATGHAGKLIGVYDRASERAAARANDWGITAYASLTELLADPAIAAVFVLTPVETHREIALAALAAGKHVLIEKPVADSVADIQAIAVAAEAAGRVAMPGHNYLYQPAPAV